MSQYFLMEIPSSLRTAVSQIAKVAGSVTATPTPMADKPPVTDANQTASRSASNSAFHMHALPQWRTTDTSRSGAIVSTNPTSPVQLDVDWFLRECSSLGSVSA
jgi:hypothetical protein